MRGDYESSAEARACDETRQRQLADEAHSDALEAEQLADEHEWLGRFTMKTIQHGMSELEDLRHRMERARALVHQAQTACESGYPLMNTDRLLTEALSELGCAGCGERIEYREMSTVAWARKTCTHIHGQCYERAVAAGRAR